MKLKGYLLAMISAISYGLIPLFILPLKEIDFSIDTTLFYRFFIATIFLGGFIKFVQKDKLFINWLEAKTLIILGLLYALSAEFLILGYDYLTPGIASTLLFVYPVFIALILFFVYKERLTKLTILSLLVTLGGVLTLSMTGTLATFNLTGLAITLLSALSYALYMIIVNKSKIAMSGVKLTLYSMTFSSLYYALKVAVMGGSLSIPSLPLLWDISLFSLVTTVFSITALIYAIQLIGSTPTSIMGALEPVVAVTISVSLFGEKLTQNLILGVALILGGVIINILSSKNKEQASH